MFLSFNLLFVAVVVLSVVVVVVVLAWWFVGAMVVRCFVAGRVCVCVCVVCVFVSVFVGVCVCCVLIVGGLRMCAERMTTPSYEGFKFYI